MRSAAAPTANAVQVGNERRDSTDMISGLVR
jgi:hypothetical protein